MQSPQHCFPPQIGPGRFPNLPGQLVWTKEGRGGQGSLEKCWAFALCRGVLPEITDWPFRQSQVKGLKDKIKELEVENALELFSCVARLVPKE